MTRGRSKASFRRAMRKKERNAELYRDGMMGKSCMRGYGMGKATK